MRKIKAHFDGDNKRFWKEFRVGVWKKRIFSRRGVIRLLDIHITFTKALRSRELETFQIEQGRSEYSREPIQTINLTLLTIIPGGPNCRAGRSMF